jgi:hypothetical protein
MRVFIDRSRTMKKIILENFRCFREYQEIELKPLTLLVGENSTGKSTFLAAISLAARLLSRGLNLDFNEEPFQLGAYDQIAHSRAGRGGRAKSFTIGFEMSAGTREAGMKATFAFRRSHRQPVAASWTLSAKQYVMTVDFEEIADKMTLTVDGLDGKRLFKRTSKQAAWMDPQSIMPFWLLPQALLHDEFIESAQNEGKDERLSGEDADELRRTIGTALSRGSSIEVRALAPIRSKPQRTYNPTRDTPEPTGGHVPMVLSRISGSDRDLWEHLVKRLRSFGQGSGLFENIEIRRLGRGGSDPFQVVVKFREGPAVNLVDVGYGVSQALPFLVDTMLANRSTIFLMQQPEVHLHPRAQAQVGTFLGQTAKALGQRFVVETHSDYLIDRVRVDVRDRVALRPEDVTILYFEKAGVETKIFPLSIDKNGNIQHAPPGYRDFFLQEERRFLGVAQCV